MITGPEAEESRIVKIDLDIVFVEGVAAFLQRDDKRLVSLEVFSDKPPQAAIILDQHYLFRSVHVIVPFVGVLSSAPFGAAILYKKNRIVARNHLRTSLSTRDLINLTVVSRTLMCHGPFDEPMGKEALTVRRLGRVSAAGLAHEILDRIFKPPKPDFSAGEYWKEKSDLRFRLNNEGKPVFMR